MIYIISRGSNRPSAFLISFYRPYSEKKAKIEFFVKKSYKYRNFTGFLAYKSK